MFRRVFNKTIILLGLAGYEMVITNSALRASFVIYDIYPAGPRRIIVNYAHWGSTKESETELFGFTT